jgi:hypothetical protein
MMAVPLSWADAQQLPPTLDVATTARLLGISRTTAYHLAATDHLPVPVLRIGHTYRIPTAPLLTLLGITRPVTDNGTHHEDTPHPDKEPPTRDEEPPEHRLKPLG